MSTIDAARAAAPRAADHPADRLLDAIERRGAPVCVGIDPVLERLPLRDARAAPARAISTFALEVIDAVADVVPCVKLQSACFERYGADGVAGMHAAVGAARERGLVVILDAKRGDIGISAAHYAAAAFGSGAQEARDGGADWITINGYFGADGIEPFVRDGRGAFALVRTSNPSADALQALRLEDGATVAEAMARIVAAEGRASIGARGFSALGAVVGATRPEAAARLRALMPQQMLLVPGFGAQGGGVADVLPCFRADGTGAVVTASRSVIYAHEGDEAGPWQGAVTRAARRLAEQLGEAVG